MLQRRPTEKPSTFARRVHCDLTCQLAALRAMKAGRPVGERQQRRRALAAGEARPRWRRSPEAEQRILVLYDEGMPADWIAEDVKEKPNTVRSFARDAGVNTDIGWRDIRLEIIKDPALRALHEEFAP